MTPSALLLALATMTPVPDSAGRPILWPARYPATVVQAVLEQDTTQDPVWLAVALATIAATESGYSPRAIGDHGASCGLYQTPCAQTPHDAVGQARLAIRVLHLSTTRCPAYPLALYTSGRCAPNRVATLYEARIQDRYLVARAIADAWEGTSAPPELTVATSAGVRTGADR